MTGCGALLSFGAVEFREVVGMGNSISGDTSPEIWVFFGNFSDFRTPIFSDKGLGYHFVLKQYCFPYLSFELCCSNITRSSSHNDCDSTRN